MKSRRSDNQNESMELLLDTVCNTFGGLLFICMLVALIAAPKSQSPALEPPSPAVRVTLIECQTQLAEAELELERLEAAASASERIQDRFSSEESVELARQASSQAARLSDTRTSQNKIVDQTTDLQEDINQTAADMAAQRKELQELAEAKAISAARLAEEIEKRSRTTASPIVSDWNGDKVGFLLQQGELFEIGTSETNEIRDGDVKRVEPAPGKGLRVTGGPRSKEAIKARFSGYSPTRIAVQIFVSVDSFPEFDLVRETLVELKLRYVLEILGKDTFVYLTTGAGGTSRVQ